MAAHKTHGLGSSRFYSIYRNMIRRCNSKNSISYKNYGAKGISYEWVNFEEFMEDMYKDYITHLDQYGEKDTTLDRIDNNKNYSNINCKWATRAEQARNTSQNNYLTLNGITKTLSDWSSYTGIKRTTIGMRLRKYGWTIEKALTTKV